MKKKPNKFLVEQAIEKFQSEKEHVLSETDPPVFEKYLRPDPEVTTTLRNLNRKLFAVDGIIEICRSVGYSGWARRDLALPKVIEQNALPRDFLNYPGEDACCETGSQARYSLRSISEPLHDHMTGTTTVQIQTVLAQSRYADVFRLSRLLDKPFIERDGRILSGRSLHGHSWFPLETSPLIHNVNTQPIVITKDYKVILFKRSMEVDHYPGCWSASLEEQMVAFGDELFKPDLTYFDCAERGVREELACTPNPEKTRILSVGIEYGNLSASFLCVVWVEETFQEACAKWLQKALDIYENSAIDCVALRKRDITEMLKDRNYKPSKDVRIRKDGRAERWHPTSRMRLYALTYFMEKMEDYLSEW